MLVVSDTSPLRAFAHLELLSILPALYDPIVVPPAVLRELETPTRRFPALPREGLPFVRVASPVDEGRVRELELKLERAEAEAIALALEVETATLLMDEAKGRAVAAGFGLPVIGTLGVLRDAKTAGLVPRVGPLIGRLTSEISFFLDADLVEEVLRQVGEPGD